MPKLFNLARVTTATTGTGTITLGAAVDGFNDFADAWVSDGDRVSYAIKDGSNSEVGWGVYTASGTTLTRNVRHSTNGDNAISLSGDAEVFITPSSEDLQRANVRVASTANVTISSGLENGDIINGITLATGDLVLLKDQTTQSENGIYYVPSSGAAPRAYGFETWSDFVGREIVVHEGKGRIVAPCVADVAENSNNTSVSSGSVTNPGGIAVGDLLIMIVALSGTFTAAVGPTNWSAPSGITNSDSNRLLTWAHIADSTDVAAGSFTFSWSTSTRRYTAQLLVIRGHDGSSWNNTSANGSQTSSATQVSPKPVPTVDRCLCLRYFTTNANTTLSSLDSAANQFVANNLQDLNPGSGPRTLGTIQELPMGSDVYGTSTATFGSASTGMANQITIQPPLTNTFTGTQVWTSDAGLTGTLGTDALTFSRGDEYGAWELIHSFEAVLGIVPCFEFIGLDSTKYSRYKLTWNCIYTIENTATLALNFGYGAATAYPTWLFDQYAYRNHVWYVNIDAPDTDGDDNIYATDNYTMYLGSAEGNTTTGNAGFLEITTGYQDAVAAMNGESVMQQFNAGTQKYGAGYLLNGFLWDNAIASTGINGIRIWDTESSDPWGPGGKVQLWGYRKTK